MPATMDGGTMTATLPDMPDAANLIPELLVRQGRLSVVDPSGQTIFDNGHIDGVAIDLDEAGMPVTMLKLNAEARAALKDMNETPISSLRLTARPFRSPRVDAAGDAEHGLSFRSR